MTSPSTRSRSGSAAPTRGRLLSVARRARRPATAGGCGCCTTPASLDDPTRLLRLARYAARLGFSVEPHTRDLAAAAVRRRRAGDGQRRPDRDRAAAAGARAGSGRRRWRARRAGDRRGDRRRVRHPDRARELARARAGAAARPTATGPVRGRGRRASASLEPEQLAALLDRLAFDAPARDAIVAAAARRRARVAAALGAAGAVGDRRRRRRGAPARAGGAGRRARSGASRARRGSSDAAARPARDHRRGLLAAGDARGRPIGAGLAAALAAKLDGHAAGGRERDELAPAAARAGATRGGGLGLAARWSQPRPSTRWASTSPIDLPGARAVFTTRRGGCSGGPYASLNLGWLTDDDPGAVSSNRAALAGRHRRARSSFVRQVHGAEVRRITADSPPVPAQRPRVDGQATTADRAWPRPR